MRIAVSQHIPGLVYIRQGCQVNAAIPDHHRYGHTIARFGCCRLEGQPYVIIVIYSAVAVGIYKTNIAHHLVRLLRSGIHFALRLEHRIKCEAGEQRAARLRVPEARLFQHIAFISLFCQDIIYTGSYILKLRFPIGAGGSSICRCFPGSIIFLRMIEGNGNAFRYGPLGLPGSPPGSVPYGNGDRGAFLYQPCQGIYHRLVRRRQFLCSQQDAINPGIFPVFRYGKRIPAEGCQLLPVGKRGQRKDAFHDVVFQAGRIRQCLPQTAPIRRRFSAAGINKSAVHRRQHGNARGGIRIAYL